MAYVIHAIVSSRNIILPLAKSRSSARVIDLQQGFSLIPLTDELYDEVNHMDARQFDNPALKRFHRLSPRVVEWIMMVSLRTSVAYIEAEFFGGTGSQSSVVWELNRIIHGPEHSRWAINKALRHLGVLARGNELLGKVGIYKHYFKDEFELLGLGQCRHTEDWLKVGG